MQLSRRQSLAALVLAAAGRFGVAAKSFLPTEPPNTLIRDNDQGRWRLHLEGNKAREISRVVAECLNNPADRRSIEANEFRIEETKNGITVSWKIEG